MSLVDTVHGLATQGPGRYLCPKCTGGMDQEHSLSVRRDEAGGVHWRCFRSTCGYTGGPRGTRSVFAEKKKEPRYFTRPIKPLTSEQEILIGTKFGKHAGLLEAIDGYSYWDDRFILPVFGPVGWNERGTVAYSFNQKPKSLTYNEKPNEPFLHWTGARNVDGPTDIVVVEDWFSAEKVALTQEAQGVALFGTHITQADITEIATVAGALGGRVYLALDRDAFPKTVGYLAQYREQFPQGLYAWSLKKDLKYESVERIQRGLDGEVDFSRDVEHPEHV